MRGVAKDRKLEEAQVRALVDRGMLLPDEAISAHLIDHTGYRDEAEKAAKTRAGKGAALVTALNYLDRAGRPHEKGPTIALIYGTGLIQRGSSTSNPFSESGLMGADTVSRAFDKAAGDGDVRAILFRVDSPGGSAVASETIWRAVLRAHQSGKPVIVSMGAVAGSGGYYIAAPADKIVAEPATLTGSIGVLAGKFVLSGLWDKLGVGWGALNEGASADMFSTLQDFSPPEKQRFEEFLDAAYGTFKDRVAQGRKLSAEAVETVAKGRVWTGEDAKSTGTRGRTRRLQHRASSGKAGSQDRGRPGRHAEALSEGGDRRRDFRTVAGAPAAGRGRHGRGRAQHSATHATPGAARTQMELARPTGRRGTPCRRRPAP